jgi:hypothetical protein
MRDLIVAHLSALFTPLMVSPREAFSKAFFHGKRPCCWRIRLVERRTEVSGSPFTITCPEVGLRRPARRYRREDFPQPVGPITTHDDPAARVRST